MSYDESESRIMHLEKELDNAYGGAQQEINGLTVKKTQVKQCDHETPK